jgi:hypothetical protein
MKNLIKNLLTFVLTLSSSLSFSQINITNSSTLTEVFNIGTSTSASLPSGWKMSVAAGGNSANWTTSSNVTNVTQSAQSGNPTAGGRYNWGSSGDPNSRCVGIMTSGSYGTPNAILAFYQNNTGTTITGINLSFDYERYRINSGAASVTCFTSTNGSTWTARTTGNSGAFPTGSSTYTFSNPLIVNKSVSLTNISISNGSGFYVKWVFSTTTSNSQGIGLDNVSLTPLVPKITGSATTQPFTTVYGTSSTQQSFSISGTNLTSNIIATAPTGFEVSNDGITYGSTATFTQTSGSASGTLRIRLSSLANVIGSYNNQSIVLSSTGADNVNITTPLSGNSVSKANQTITFENIPYKTTFDLDFLPNVNSSSQLPITIASSNSSTATIVDGKIHITGIGTTTITASQLGNDNYNSATSVTKELIVENPVSRWTFDNMTFSGTGQTPTISNGLADLGDQTENTTMNGFHQSASTSWTSPVGNGSLKSISADNWQVGDYFRYSVNTKYTTIIRLTFDQTSSATGPKDFKLQWSIDGLNFNDISNYNVPYNTNNNTNYSWTSGNYQSFSTLSFDLSSITEINDQTNVQFRMINNSTSALLGGTIQTDGTSRMDNFTMFGSMDIPLPLNIISFKGSNFGTQNRLQWTLSEWGMVKIQKLINNKWVDVGQTDNNFWFDTNTQKGLNYYRIVSDKTFSRPIYINNELGQDLSQYSFKYYDLDGKSVNNIEIGKIHIRKSEFESDKIIVVQ